MPINPYQSPKEVGTARRPKVEVSIWWCIPLAFGGMLLALIFLAPYFALPKGHNGDIFGYQKSGLIGGFAGLAIGVALRILFPPPQT